ncbi:hypothetical protein ElyMa_004468100 [Elysia marginata]|uniref:Uncharacterized protein n=1 Tax=Elysia marginata TaxID=1093978 RepID=A0AAV4HK39_9GAST|nr:hypothetical protein ElyMa_004468100 [Elysia marginata]
MFSCQQQYSALDPRLVSSPHLTINSKLQSVTNSAQPSPAHSPENGQMVPVTRTNLLACYGHTLWRSDGLSQPIPEIPAIVPGLSLPVSVNVCPQISTCSPPMPFVTGCVLSLTARLPAFVRSPHSQADHCPSQGRLLGTA